MSLLPGTEKGEESNFVRMCMYVEETQNCIRERREIENQLLNLEHQISDDGNFGHGFGNADTNSPLLPPQVRRTKPERKSQCRTKSILVHVVVRATECECINEQTQCISTNIHIELRQEDL